MILVGVIPLIKSSGYTLLQTTPSGFETKAERGLKEVSLYNVVELSRA